MGIIIFYRYEFNGSKEELLETLKNIRKEILNLDLISVSEIKNRKDDTKEKMKNDFNEILKNPDLKDKKVIEIFTKLRNDCHINLLGFIVNVMNGCESFFVELEEISKNNWSGFDSTKTEYCINFIKGHHLITELLEICKKNGILKSVKDDSKYWNNRNIVKLQDNKKRSEIFINNMVKWVKNQGFKIIRKGND